MYRRILALLEGPDSWPTVISQVERLATGRDVEVTLLLVMDAGDEPTGTRRAEAEARLERAASALRRRGISVRTVVGCGSPGRELVAYSRSHPADVIVMASPPPRWR